MIDRTALLRDLQREVKALEDDLRTRAVADEATDARLRREHDGARAAGRTAESFESWREDQITQSAVAWVLACVFVRFLEDNGLLPEPLLSGPGLRRQLALDHRQLFFRAHPTDTDREYLHDVFRMVAKLPAAGDVLGDKHNPLWSLVPSGDGATRLLEFFQRVPPETGELAHDFSDPEWNTRFLGDLYQDLSEAARKKFALLQTPEFVEEFILDRTLTPAIAEFGYKEVRLIDPTCGSGHFLLGAFRRLFELHVQHEPGTNPRELAQRALDQVAGVDVNPFAVAIARFRLLLAALKASRIERLADAPGFRMHLAAGDSLLHGRRFGLATMNLQPKLLGDDPLRKHVYEAEDAEALKEILGRQYHAVVGNPPYITVNDKALNAAYRDAYSSCHRQYSMGVPFTERFFELALPGDQREPCGFAGMITANSFMKREFGKKLIEKTLPKLDLTHVIDTSGAYIPGHGTPTVILLGRNRAPVAAEVRTVMGIRGEPGTPDEPAHGKVWHAILGQVDSPGSVSDFVSVADYPRTRFKKHPWSLGGGGAAELKEIIESVAQQRLADVVEVPIGRAVRIAEEDVFMFDRGRLRRSGLSMEHFRGFLQGEFVRDWSGTFEFYVWYPYATARPEPRALQLLWPWRTTLANRSTFQGTMADAGRAWWEYMQHTASAYATPLSIAFAFVATHNHFVLDRGGKVFKQSAPVIKLPPDATEDDHLALLALLNSSTACFWMKQVFQPKSHATQRHHPDPARGVYEFTGTGLEDFPVGAFPRRRIVKLSREIVRLAEERQQLLSAEALITARNQGIESLDHALSSRWVRADEVRERMIALQEEIDWTIYTTYGLTPDGLILDDAVDLEPLHCPRGGRAFEQLGGRRSLVRRGGTVVPLQEAETPPAAELSASLAPLWRRRIEEIRRNRNLQLIERLEVKRVWRDTEDNIPELEFRKRLDKSHLREMLVDSLEMEGRRAETLTTTSRLADRMRGDEGFMEIAALYTESPDFDVAELVQVLVEGESVPVLSSCRYTPAGLRNREKWERTWALQRQEDKIDARTRLDAADPMHLTHEAAEALKKKEVGDIPVPPKYASTDFLKGNFWRLRGKLDVPKERFVSFPYCEREADPSLVIAWAGWDHLQLAQATAAYYVAMKDTEGWSHERLTPLLAVLAELVTWLRQWHNELDPEYGVGMGDYFTNFVDSEMRSLGLTPADLESWTPPKGNTAQRKKGAQRKTA